MSGSRNNKSLLLGIWFVTAIIAVVVIVSYLIKSDQDEKARLEELNKLANSSAYTPYPTARPTNIVSNTDSENNSSGDDISHILGPGNSSESSGESGSDISTPTEEPVATPEPTAGPERENVNLSGIDPLKPMVAFTFDDGPSVNTPRILEALKKYNAHATFFMVGENVAKYPEYIRAVRDAGSEPANHTVDHSDLKKLTKEQIIHEVEDNQAAINAALGTNNSLLVRPPYGNYNDLVKEACQHPMILWTVDTLDWKSRDAQAVFEEVKKSVKDGYVILFHDLYQSTAEAVEIILPWLVEQGYQVVTVSEMYAARGETLKDGHSYRYTYTVEEYKARQSQ